jgi:putative acetyltransferase
MPTSRQPNHLAHLGEKAQTSSAEFSINTDKTIFRLFSDFKQTMSVIRSETPNDSATIRSINQAAFGQVAEADLIDRLRADGKLTLSLVAEADRQLVGHIAFSPVTIETNPAAVAVAGLAPMAVLPTNQRGGLGSLLVKTGLAECRVLGYDAVVVLGHPDYYPRFGFAPASRFGLRCEYDVPDEVFMALELRPGALAECAGLVRYQAEFNEV